MLQVKGGLCALRGPQAQFSPAETLTYDQKSGGGLGAVFGLVVETLLV